MRVLNYRIRFFLGFKWGLNWRDLDIVVGLFGLLFGIGIWFLWFLWLLRVFGNMLLDLDCFVFGFLSIGIVLVAFQGLCVLHLDKFYFFGTFMISFLFGRLFLCMLMR